MLKEKLEIIEHHRNFIHYVRQLDNLDEALLRMPIQDGKWSIIEIIGHFQPWDHFVMQQRLPYLLTDKPLPVGPIAEGLNNQSSQNARQEKIHKTLEECILTRTKLQEVLTTLPDEVWLISFNINQSTLTLYSYFKGLMDHDMHHINQIKKILIDTK